MAVILGIESSCDETAVALVADGHRVLAERVASQAEVFAAWGGVVPEIAARGHVEWLPGLVVEVLHEAGCDLSDVDAVAVAAHPGLIGSLLCGVTAAKTIAAWQGLPLIAVDHVEAHLAAVHLGRATVPYPLVGLVASGGHSHIYRCDAVGSLALLGGTIDDAAGEAYDKAASMLELGYPGGPTVDRLAATVDDAGRFADLPRPFLRDPDLRFSFAGLKTALLYRVRGPQGRDPMTLDETGIAQACHGFQNAVVDCLAGKLLAAAKQAGVAAIAVGGGVACNRGLRARLAAEADRAGIELLLPEPRHCGDNAAMVASLGHARLLAGATSELTLTPSPSGSAGPRRVAR